MGNLIQKNCNLNNRSQIIKISSESITPRDVNLNNKMEIKYINSIHHRKTVKELEENQIYKINRATNFNNIKKYMYQKQTNILSEADKNNHITNINTFSNNKNILSKAKPYYSHNSRNNQNENNLCRLINPNLYEFEIDSSSKYFADKNIINNQSKKENKTNKPSNKAVQIQKKNI